MTRRLDLATRIRHARESLDITQDELAKQMGVHRRTVQGWEARHVPRTAIPALEKFFGIDLSSPPATDSPPLEEASDAQVLSDLARRLAERERENRDLRRDIEQMRAAGITPADTDETTDGTVVTPQRWAARRRISDPE